jgi:hypothetical protein
MTEAGQCGAETRKDGTKICSLHKQPLQETTMLEHVPEGKPYPKIDSSFICPVSQKVLIIPEF